jgi:predicted ATPase/DNA-binding SARP family transcriptional activator
MAGLKIYLLGAPRVSRGDAPIETGRRKATALLAYLVITGQSQRRETLAALFWPESGSSTGRADLSRILSVLRKTLGEGWLVADRQTVGLEPETDLWVDALEFRQRLALAHSHYHPEGQACETCLSGLAAAADLYLGDFMAGLTLADSPEFDDWQALQTESLRQELAGALQQLARWQTLQGDYQAALKSAQRRLNLDPLHEPAQRQLMRLYAWAGDRSAAMRQYQACCRLLDVELGLPPDETTRQLVQAIQAGQALPLPSLTMGKDARPAAYQILPSTAAMTLRHNLPPQPTPFVGRRQELAQIGSLLKDDPNCRLLTLIGPGGIGKTRLAVEAAQQALTNAAEVFPNGVYFVSLAAISSPKAIVSTIAETLNLPFYSGRSPKEQLLNYLGQKKMLMVLDNLEHLLVAFQAASQQEIEETTELLSAVKMRAPQVKLLVTSRERLNLQDEWVFEVSGMPFPSSTETEETALAKYSAVELFRQRARRARATFVLAEAEMAGVIRICQLVAGMPLGIELAAAWIRLMSCEDIAREIERGLDFLTTSLRDVPERHRSLRTVFEQSWSHLSADEAAAFRKLSVFQGGFSLRAAGRVAGATLPALSALIDKSLLRRARTGRYEIHELLRQFAAEKLAADSIESEQVRERHAEYYAVFLQQRREDFKGHRQQETLTEILREIDNVRAAWKWAVAKRKVAAIGKALECFLLTHWQRGWFQEGETALRQAAAGLIGIEIATELESVSLSKEWKSVVGKLLAGQGFFCVRLGRYESALQLVQQGVALLRQAGSGYLQDLAYSLLLASIVDEVNGRYAEAAHAIEELLTFYQKIGDRWGMGTALVRLGQVARKQGRFVEAQDHLLEGIKILEPLGDHQGVAYALDDLGHAVRALGNYPQAQHYFEQALQNRQESGDQEGTILSLKNIGDMSRVLGRYAEAQERYQESLTLAREIGYSLKIADSLDGLGTVARLQGEYEQAERYHQNSLTIYQEMGMPQRIALCLANLGRLAYDRETYEQAEQYFQQSLALCQEHGYARGRLSCLCHLGYLRLKLEGLRAQAEAGRYLYQALESAAQIRSVPVALDILVGLAVLLNQTGDKRRAVELLSLAWYHPGGEQETKDRAKTLGIELGAEPPLAVALNISTREPVLDLWAMVAEYKESK